MTQISLQPMARWHLLRNAVTNHTRLTKAAATGHGIDRHLLGLNVMRSLHKLPQALDMFSDHIYQESQRWRLSTSGLSAGHLFRGTG